MTDPFAERPQRVPERPLADRSNDPFGPTSARTSAPIEPPQPGRGGESPSLQIPAAPAATAAPSRRVGRSRRRRTNAIRLPVVAIAVLAGVVASQSGAEPTVIGWWNMVLTGLAVALVTVLASFAPRPLLLVLTCVATGLGGLNSWSICGLVATVIVLGAIAVDRHELLDRYGSVVSAIAVGLALQLLLRLPQNWFFGFESLVVAIVAGAAATLGYRKLARRSRRRMRQVLVVASFVSMFAVFVAAVVALDARGPAQDGVSAAQAGLQSARNGDVEETVASLSSAQSSFRTASETLDAPWAIPAKFVPVISQHLRLLSVSSATGSTLADAASVAVRSADIEELSLANGAVDVATLRDLAPNLDRLATEMSGARDRIAESRSPWILAALDTRVDGFTAELERAAPEAELAAAASRVVPDLMGASGPRNYMLLFGSPSESRELGGFVGSWAMIEADGGALTKVNSGRAIDLYERARAGSFDNPDEYPRFFIDAEPGRWPQNLTSMPQIEDVAKATADLFPELEGRSIDGVAYLDPYVVQGLLQLIGPLQVEGSDVVLTGENAAEFLFTDQYREFGDDDTLGAERHQFLSDTFDATFAALTSSALPGPERLGAVLGPLAREGRLQFATFDDEANAFLERVHLLQRLGDPLESDVLSVVHVNGTANKLDAFVTRDVSYRVVVDSATRELTGEVEVDLSLDVPSGVPEYVFGVEGRNGDYAAKEHRVLLSIYTPHRLLWSGIDGEAQIARTEDEFGLRRYVVPVLLHVDDRPEATVRFVLEGTLLPGENYVLDIANQPLVNRDLVQIEVTNAATGRVTSASVELDQDLRLTWPLADQ